MHFQSDLLPDDQAGDRFLRTDGQQRSTIHPFFWPVLPALSPYLDASEGTGLLGTGLLDYRP